MLYSSSPIKSIMVYEHLDVIHKFCLDAEINCVIANTGLFSEEFMSSCNNNNSTQIYKRFDRVRIDFYNINDYHLFRLIYTKYVAEIEN